MAEFEIYALLCPYTFEVKYIGKANNSVKRLKSHISDSKRRLTPVYEWIRNLTSNGDIPILIILSKTNDWIAKEIQMISFFRSLGFNLLNVSEGGNQPFCSNDTRKQNAISNSKKRDPNKWRTRHLFGQSMKWLKTNNKQKYNELANRINSSKAGLYYEII